MPDLDPLLRPSHFKRTGRVGGRPGEIELFATCHTGKIVAGKVLFCEGHSAGHLYQVIAGTLRLCKILRDGRRQITGFPSAGNFVGISDDGFYLHTAEAVSTVTFLRYSQSDITRRLEQGPGFAQILLNLRSKELCVAENHMLLLGRKAAIEKLATFLLQLANDSRTISHGVVRIPMKRLDIADYLGLTVETVSRLFFKLKCDGMIEIQSNSSLMILDRDRLENLSAGDPGRADLHRSQSARG